MKAKKQIKILLKQYPDFENIISGSVSIYFSLCGPVTGDNSCAGGGACYKDATGNLKNIGDVTHGPHVSSQDGGVVLSYLTRQQSQSCPTLTTIIVLACTPHQVSVLASEYSRTCFVILKLVIFSVSKISW